jgi:hypothetical protein
MAKHLPCPVSECSGKVRIDESAPGPPRLQWPVTCSSIGHPLWLNVFPSGGYTLSHRGETARERRGALSERV